jgi:hypothetical protein
MAAATGATGIRTWLQAYHPSWLTPRVMRITTIVVFSLALGVSTIGLSGSTAHLQHARAAVSAPAAR